MAFKSHALAREKSTRINVAWPSLDETVFETLGVTREELATLETQLLGQIILPGMPGYDAMEMGAEGLCPYRAHPTIVVRCVTFNDVRLCLEWARKHHWWLTCRSGGHSTAGFSTNNGLVIDVSGLSYVSVDPVLKQARVGAGTRFAQLNATLEMYRLHTPGGSCSDVGVAGFMQGGGYGITSREFGMNCDNVLAVTVMLADGRMVIADRTENTDLYWAMRGGTGGNFGVLLEITYQLHDLYELYGFCLQWPITDATQVLVELQRSYMAEGATSRLGYLTELATANAKKVLIMVGVFDGSRSDALEVLAPLRSIGNPDLVFDRTDTYARLNDELDDILDTAPMPTTIREWKRGGYISAPVQLADWQRIVDCFEEAPSAADIVAIEPYGGAINAVPIEDSAFIHRDVSMDLFADSFWTERGDFTHNVAAREWVDSCISIAQPLMNGHVYQNYPYREFPNFRWAYWGEAFNSLLFVKQKYDPDNLFHFEQSISPYPDNAGINRATTPSRFNDPHINDQPYSMPDS
jgi:FAD/FMN-containing dehydrogenase